MRSNQIEANQMKMRTEIGLPGGYSWLPAGHEAIRLKKRME
jgi:hypothetical protein